MIRLAAAALFWGGTLGAAPPVDCPSLESELESKRQEITRLEGALEQSQAISAEADRLRGEIAKKEEEIARLVGDAEAANSSRTSLCQGLRQFSASLSAGRVDPSGVGECLAEGAQSALVEQLSGTHHTERVLAQLGAYGTGESDVIPRMGPLTGSRIEKLLARLFTGGSGSPIWNRRILIEAFSLVAPNTWASIKRRPGNVERWFASSSPLEAELISEAQRGLSEPSPGKSEETGPLSTALDLVFAYERLSRCGEPNAPKDCARAAELRLLLESSGPLAERRRLESVWEIPCSSWSLDTVSSLTSALPRSKGEASTGGAVPQAITEKLFTCYLRDSSRESSFAAYLSEFEDGLEKTAQGQRVLELSRQKSSEIDTCARAARALQNLPTPQKCATDSWFSEVEAWARRRSERPPSSEFIPQVCDRFVASLWAGGAPTISDSFRTAPTPSDALRLLEEAPHTSVFHLRELCHERIGSESTFPASVRALSKVAVGLGESSAAAPFFVDEATGLPLEAVRFQKIMGFGSFLRSLGPDQTACSLLELPTTRCDACRTGEGAAAYDCAVLSRVERSYAARLAAIAWGILGSVMLLLLGNYFLRRRRARNSHGAWRNEVLTLIENLGFRELRSRLDFLLPSRLAEVSVAFPEDPRWARFGKEATIVHMDGAQVRDRDVNYAASAARSRDRQVALLIHADGASPDLGAIRTMLDWAARPGARAVHVLPLPMNRLRWAQSAGDLLELAEEATLRTNPFEVRGRVSRSSQFFGRERLVSGLLAAAQAGHMTVITGLRRFGKSSLSLEVVRRLPGPSAYVDLAGFHHEIRHQDPRTTADSILGFVCERLIESESARAPERPRLSSPTGPMDASTLSRWFREFLSGVAAAQNGRNSPALIVFDELEQAIGSAEDMSRALEVLDIVVGRLRNSLPGSDERGLARVGVIFASAVHPLLWAPLGTLAHQSLMGSYAHVAVPALPQESAGEMMMGLGSRQGIRFEREALDLVLQESQGIPLLVRRLGTAVLELYDPERAREGALGAVQIGIEGVRAAIEREISDGSPVKVWVESEIAELGSPGGEVLRALSRNEQLEVPTLRSIAQKAFERQFADKGMHLSLSREENLRRAQEAAGVVVRMLGESGLLVAHGDPTEPSAYELPHGLVRKVLSGPSQDAETRSTAGATATVS